VVAEYDAKGAAFPRDVRGSKNEMRTAGRLDATPDLLGTGTACACYARVATSLNCAAGIPYCFILMCRVL